MIFSMWNVILEKNLIYNNVYIVKIWIVSLSCILSRNEKKQIIYKK